MTRDRHNNRPSEQTRPVVVMIGQPDPTLLVGIRSIGLTPIAEDGQVTVWGKRPDPPVMIPVSAPEEAKAARANGLLLTIADAALALGLGRSTVYELIGRGELEVVHVGRSARVPTEALSSLVKRLRADQASRVALIAK